MATPTDDPTMETCGDVSESDPTMETIGVLSDVPMVSRNHHIGVAPPPISGSLDHQGSLYV